MIKGDVGETSCYVSKDCRGGEAGTVADPDECPPVCPV